MDESVRRQSGASEESEIDPSGDKPWGFWGTTGLGALVFAIFLLVQGLIFYAFAQALQDGQSGIPMEELILQLESNGQAVALSTCATGILCTALILLLARVRRGIGVREYLGLQALPWRTLLAWLGIGIAVALASDLIMLLTGREVVREFMIEIYRTATNLPLLWIALVVAAPLFEEFLFRGFLFRGWLNTRLGATGTILLTSALWTAIHLQYDMVDLSVVFVYGILLGLARYRTGSLIAPLVIHGAINLAAIVQVMLAV